MSTNEFGAVREFFLKNKEDPFCGTVGREWNKPDYMLHFLSERTPNDLYIVNCGLEQCTSLKPKKFGEIWFYSIHYVVRGQGWFEVEGVKHQLKAGDVFIIPPHADMCYYPDENAPWEYVSVDVFGVLSSFVDSVVGYPRNLVFHASEESGLKQDFFRLEKSVFNTGEKSFQSTGLLYLLLDKINRLFGKKETHGSGEINDYVRSALKYIRYNYQTVTVKDVAANCHVSSEHLSRLCKSEVGYTLKECVTIYRMQLALDYLKMTFFDENKIAGLVGYSSGKYFKQVFYSIFGKSTERHRKDLKMVKSEDENENEPKR